MSANPDREITADEWIAASQACCGAEPDEDESAGGEVREPDRVEGPGS